MNPWTALLETLHSAWIEELIEFDGDRKPELGMPKRLARFSWPIDGKLVAVYCDVSFGERGGAGAGANLGRAGGANGVGVILLAFDSPAAQRAKDPMQILDRIKKRAEEGFLRRGIQPTFGNPKPGTDDPLFEALTRVIWIPAVLRGERFWLGMGIE